MAEFIDLRSFLCLKNPITPHRYLHESTSMDAHKWVEYYDRAKKSFEAYGDNPPIGSDVMTLISGFGGFGGRHQKRKLARIDTQDPRFFDLREINSDRYYLANRTVWWAEFYILD